MQWYLCVPVTALTDRVHTYSVRPSDRPPAATRALLEPQLLSRRLQHHLVIVIVIVIVIVFVIVLFVMRTGLHAQILGTATTTTRSHPTVLCVPLPFGFLDHAAVLVLDGAFSATELCLLEGGENTRGV